jgi:5'-nucleotidase
VIRPLILVTNDDGVNAPGLLAIVKRVTEDADVIVVAPATEQSAVSHKITLHKPLRVKEVAPGRFACSGTPVDCVQVALGQVMTRHPDLVISGINSGPNLGDDVIYSGTVAGAREAALWGLPAVAFSLAQMGGTYDFETVADVAHEIVKVLLDRRKSMPPNVLVNVNLPQTVRRDTPWQVTQLGGRNYNIKVSKHRDPRDRPYYWTEGDMTGLNPVEGTDVHAVIKEARVSITPVPVRVTSEEHLKLLRTWGLQPFTK